MHRRTIIIGVAVLAGAVGIGGAAFAVAGEDEGEGVTGPGADAAIAAALEATGGGRANSVELDNEDGATWEVEVTKPDGATVDVRLDAAYGVVVIEGDSEAADTDD
jgi:Peptidase propeptide and YPEB domain